ncbi:serine hydrolase [Photobacterium sp. OFAV2-7]|uniref:serine hydrolase domain-containing protein n=1 Tax=Photobacterium sp. OFAV2-7 TaxID=2917748 RepID=UPI001EF62F0D|nr:serine hydrolase [Photobacterium sp. OFAV2-7]MCG7587113.1 beta-lactamase family protein [Photobacterium sp. OFAV2-7]
MKLQVCKRKFGLLSLSVLIGLFGHSVLGQESDGTAPEITTLNIPSKLPFVDRTQFAIRGEITYSVPTEINDGLEVDDARKYANLDGIQAYLNGIEEQNQKYRIGKEVRYKKGKGKKKILGNIDSVLIAKDGKLVLEEYFADARQDKLHYQMSITKSIVAHCIGKAIDLGKIGSENDFVLDYLPEVDRSKVAPSVDTLTIKDLLTMSSGIRYKAANHKGTGHKEAITVDNHAELYLANTRPITIDKRFKYDGTNVDLLVHTLHNATGLTLAQAAEKYLFTPLGIEHYRFEKSACGLDKGAAGMGLTSRDMMKVGLMTMNNGVYKGNQVLSKSWIERETAVHANKDKPSSYGYLWWSHEAEVNGTTYRVRSARGAGGQFIFMVPELQLSAVFTSYYANNHPIKHFEEIIIPAFVQE